MAWKDIVVFCTVFLCAAGVAIPSPAPAETLEKELRSILTGHPQVTAAHSTVNAAEEAVGVARSGLKPSVRLTADGGPEYADLPSRRVAGQPPTLKPRRASSLTVTQRLYDGEATVAGIDAARYAQDASEAALASTRINVLIEGVAAYLDVLRQSRLLALAQDNERNIEKQAALAAEKVKGGSGAAVDVLQARHRLQLAKEKRLAGEGALQLAYARYEQVFGHMPNPRTMKEPRPPLDLLPISLNEAVATAAVDNPALTSTARAIDMAREKKRQAEAGNWPTVDLVGKADHDSNKDGTLGTKRGVSLLVQLNWDLYSGYRTRAQTAQAAHEHAATQDTHRHAGRKIAEATRMSWQSFQTARARVQLLEDSMTLAKEVLTARRQLRDAGKATDLEVLDAESDINGAEANYVSASYDLRLAAFQLLHAIGRIEAVTGRP